jgi:hypothetical protein
MGAVDPYLNAETHVVYFIDPLTGESKFELEEIFFTTQKPPYQPRGFFTESAGSTHASSPVELAGSASINTHLGPDGMRGPVHGLLTPLPGFLKCLRRPNANGETMASFLANEEFLKNGHRWSARRP